MFFCLNTNFVWSPNAINICLILSTIYIFIHVSSRVGSDPSALLLTGAYVALKTVLQWFLATVLYILWMFMCTWYRDSLINIYQCNLYILNLIYTIGEMYSAQAYLTRCGSQSINQSGRQSGSQSVFWIIFVLYHGENKLHSMRWWWCLLCSRPTHLVLTNCDNSPQVNMSPHSDTLSRFRANQSLLFLLNAACWAEKQQITIV